MATVTSLSDGGSIWFDATDEFDGPEEFSLDTSPLEVGTVDCQIASIDGQSNSHYSEEASDTDEEDAHPSFAISEHQVTVGVQQVVHRTSLPSGPVADEGSLFAVFKKNVGKVLSIHRIITYTELTLVFFGQDLSSIAFPVTFNEPLTLLQRTAEEVEYYDLLHEASQTQDPIERMCYVAAFAISGYAHTRHRSSRKGL